MVLVDGSRVDLAAQPAGFEMALERESRIDADALAALARRCLLYTSDAADERSSVDLGGRRIIKKKKKTQYRR